MTRLSELATKRKTTKVFDATRKLSEAQIAEIKTLLQYTPSSTNSQPWHFVITNSAEGKARIAKATDAGHQFNSSKILDASHVIVLCTKNVMDEGYLEQLLEQESKDGRFANEEFKKGQHTGRSFYANMHRYELKDAQHWMEKQVYIALGSLLLGASVMGIDACPIEGFNASVLNEELGLRLEGLNASVIVALGYHAESDINQSLPKSRLPQDVIFSEI